MPARTAVVRDGTRRRQKARGLTASGAPRPATLAVTRRPLRMLAPVLAVATRALVHPRPAFPLGGPRALHVVGEAHVGPVGDALEPLAAALLRGGVVPTTLPQAVAPRPSRIDGAPQRLARTSARPSPLVPGPGVPGRGTTATALVRLRWPQRLTPCADRRIRHGKAAGEAPRVALTRAEAEAAIQPDAMADHVSGNAGLGVGRRGPWRVHACLPSRSAEMLDPGHAVLPAIMPSWACGG
jgi:hypothetical protein